MPFKEKFDQAMTLRGYLISPWKLLFKKKVLYGVLIFVLAYWILPPSVTQYVDKVVSPVWKVTRAIAAEIGLVGLVKNSASGVSATVDFIQGPDEIENSLGEAVFYAGKPKIVGDWELQVADNVQVAMGGALDSRYQIAAYQLSKGKFELGTEWPSGVVALSPFEMKEQALVAIDKREMIKAWKSAMRKLYEDSESMDHLWCLAGVERDGSKNVQGLFLMMVDEYRQEIRTQSFYLPRHIDSKDKLSSYLISVDELEEKLSIDVFTGLEDVLEAKLESEKPEWAW